ncbi:hypothetical protein [Sunxiuqinia sp. sy24]|uniref:hypothetical protein n=1 Tax=Sunxiuqinia sp. sy24 TaxID=3461495 RepID=UPI004045E78C
MLISLFRDKLLILIAATFIIYSCSKNEVDNPIIDTVLEVPVSKLEFDRIGTTKTIEITTNQSPVFCESGVAWCSASYAEGVITVETTTNQQAVERAAIISVKAGELKKSFSVSQSGLDSYQGDIKDDIKVAVSGAEASSYQPGASIERSFDGDYTNGYHSKWDNHAEDYFPITLDYHFSNVSAIDYLVYYPRQSGTNGLFKEFELWVATEDNPTLTKYGDYDFNGSSVQVA